MRLPPIHQSQVFKIVEHEFMQTPSSTRSGFKILSVCPKDEESCVLIIDLDAKSEGNNRIEAKVLVEDALRIATYILNQPLVDIVNARSQPKPKEKEDDETQH